MGVTLDVGGRRKIDVEDLTLVDEEDCDFVDLITSINLGSTQLDSKRTLRDTRSSSFSATQSLIVVHFPMPPLAEDLVYRARVLASMIWPLPHTQPR
jgi:hypothetical protein